MVSLWFEQPRRSYLSRQPGGEKEREKERERERGGEESCTARGKFITIEAINGIFLKHAPAHSSRARSPVLRAHRGHVFAHTLVLFPVVTMSVCVYVSHVCVCVYVCVRANAAYVTSSVRGPILRPRLRTPVEIVPRFIRVSE